MRSLCCDASAVKACMRPSNSSCRFSASWWRAWSLASSSSRLFIATFTSACAISSVSISANSALVWSSSTAFSPSSRVLSTISACKASNWLCACPCSSFAATMRSLCCDASAVKACMRPSNSSCRFSASWWRAWSLASSSSRLFVATFTSACASASASTALAILVAAATSLSTCSCPSTVARARKHSAARRRRSKRYTVALAVPALSSLSPLERTATPPLPPSSPPASSSIPVQCTSTISSTCASSASTRRNSLSERTPAALR